MPRPPKGDGFKWLSCSLSFFHSLPSLHVSLSLASLFVSLFSLFFLTDALLIRVVLRLQSAARLTLMLRPSRGWNQCVCVCFHDCKGVRVCLSTSLLLFHPNSSHLSCTPRSLKARAESNFLKLFPWVWKVKKDTTLYKWWRKTWLALSRSTSTIWHVLCIAAGSLRSGSYTSTKSGARLKVRGILAEGVGGGRREEGRRWDE